MAPSKPVQSSAPPPQSSHLSDDAALLVPLCAAVAVAAGVTQLLADDVRAAPLFGNPAATKPFATFAEFFPFYMREHAHPTTRLLHYIGTSLFALGVAASPSLLIPLLLGLVAGSTVVFPLTRRLPSGAIEFAVLLSFFLLLGRRLTRSWVRTLAPPIVAYSFAWAAHFLVEHNRPATFIYPTFSLLGDFLMLGRAIAAGKV